MMPENLSGLHGEEERIRNCSLEFIESDLSLNDSINKIFYSLDTIYSILKAYITRDKDDLAIQYLGIRLFNSISSMQKLLYSGYYQSAFMIMRDIVETGSLLDYFTLDSTKIKLWHQSADTERKKLFKQVTIREALDNRDGYKTKRRAEIYSMYSEYASHPTFAGSKLISIEGLGLIGPFYYSGEECKELIREVRSNVDPAEIVLVARLKKKWHFVDDIKPDKDFEKQLKEIDTNDIFWV